MSEPRLRIANALRRWGVLLAAVLLAGCAQQGPRELVVYTAEETATPTITAGEPAVVVATATPLLAATAAGTAVPGDSSLADAGEFDAPQFAGTEIAAPGVTGTPLRFDFGTTEAQPTLAWRPPPMQVPVSIRPEDHFWFARPIASDAVSWPHPTYRYGGTFFGNMSVHAGTDLDADIGTPVLAAGPGVVAFVGYGLFNRNSPESDPYGLAVAIRHSFGYLGQDLYTVYAHMSQADVWPDQQVQEGDLLGLSGNTGNSSGPHLHFEVRIGENLFSKTRNPELWLAPPTGWGVIAGRFLDEDGLPAAEVPMMLRNEFGQSFLLWSYGSQIANPDEIYEENFAISDLPAGQYFIEAEYEDTIVRGELAVRAGQTSFVVLQAGYPDGHVFREASPYDDYGPAPAGR